MPALHRHTSECVSQGHPDKIADQISDALLDAALAQDPEARVAIEALVTKGLAVVSGELTTTADVPLMDVVRDAILEAGYDRPEYGFDGNRVGILTSVNPQSEEIGRGVDTGGAGDQGMMFGFACNETERLMPLPIALARDLTNQVAAIRATREDSGLRPDAKSQATVIYDGYAPQRVETVVMSAQHDPDIDFRQRILELVIKPVLCKYERFTDEPPKLQINPAGSFTVGGPDADTGLTGRKIIVDTYGGMCPHGGGAFSGKDPTKVDRSAGYAARWVAKNVVASGVAERCQIEVAYAIGVVEPVAVAVRTFGTERADPQKISEAIASEFDLSPRGIIEALDLKRPIYHRTAKHGHFGNEEHPWEATNRTEPFRALY